MNHGDPKNPKKNPHPVKRYEVTATSEAPGPWDSVKGKVFFDVINKDCVPRDSFTGGQNVPNTGYDFEMTHVDGKTWKGYFYRDMLLDEDYFGQGICHWDATGVTPVFVIHGETFGASTWLEDALRKGPQTDYFRKSAYEDHSLTGDGALDFSAINPEYIKHPDAFFPITVTVKEVTP
jgi:hypothetical protein